MGSFISLLSERQRERVIDVVPFRLLCSWLQVINLEVGILNTFELVLVYVVCLLVKTMSRKEMGKIPTWILVQMVVKSQILAGGRGLGTFKNGLKGGVHIVKKEQVEDIAGTRYYLLSVSM